MRTQGMNLVRVESMVSCDARESAGTSLTLSYEQIAGLFHQYREELTRRLVGMVRSHETAADLVQDTYERLKRMNDQQDVIVPTQQIDEARMTWHAAAANSLLYTTRLKKTVIRAPFGGTVGLRRVSVGDYVQPGQDIVNLEDLSTLHVDFKVAEVWLSRLHVGQKLIVTTDAFPQTTFDGQVTAIDPRVDATNRTVAVRAAIPNPAGTLRPGLFVTVRLNLGEHTHALLIPEEAGFLRQDKAMVFRLEERTARLTEVTLGLRDRGLVQVRSGLKEGDHVVRTGTHKLHDGELVSIKSAE